MKNIKAKSLNSKDHLDEDVIVGHNCKCINGENIKHDCKPVLDGSGLSKNRSNKNKSCGGNGSCDCNTHSLHQEKQDKAKMPNHTCSSCGKCSK